MKTLKITLLLALFLSVSSQSDKTPADQNIVSFKQEADKHILIAHQRPGVKLPGHE